MKVKMILPALIEEKSDYWRTIAYSRFPPLGLATLAGYLNDNDEITIEDEHVEEITLDDTPDLFVGQVYITNAYQSYKFADYYRSRGVYVVMGGLHVTSLPQEAAEHADTVCLGLGEDTFPEFLKDFRTGSPKKIYQSKTRTLIGMPKIRRDLIKNELCLVPNSIVVYRGCPHKCDFCYKNSFYKGGKLFYTQAVDAVLDEINQMPGKYLFFLDDNLFGDPHFAAALFDGLKGMKRVWQAAGTVQAALNESLIEKAAKSGLKSLFVGFETLSEANLKGQNKFQNLNRDYKKVINNLHSLGVMVNASFVFGMDNDDESVFDSTVDWGVENSLETASFHILTPYQGTTLYEQMSSRGRLLHYNWTLYDTKHAVFMPAKMSPERLEEGFMQAYNKFYTWGSILKGAWGQDSLFKAFRQIAYTGAWKKFEPLWNVVIKSQKLKYAIPLLEKVLSGIGRRDIESPRQETVTQLSFKKQLLREGA